MNDSASMFIVEKSNQFKDAKKIKDSNYKHILSNPHTMALIQSSQIGPSC